MDSANKGKEDVHFGLPPQTQRFNLQIAGHASIKYGEESGILKHENGDLLKPLFEKDLRSITEQHFYETVFVEKCNHPVYKELRQFLPEFHGVWETQAFGKNMRYLCLEDVCSSVQFPSVLDIKIGSKAYDQYASKEKQLDLQTKYACGEKLGIRVAGMKTFDYERRQYQSESKTFWRSRSSENLISGFDKYLTPNAKTNHQLVAAILHKLQTLLQWFRTQKEYEFIASSLLFVYEGNLPAWGGFENHPQEGTCHLCHLPAEVCGTLLKTSLVQVKMIDFAHSYPTTFRDDNYIHGLENLVVMFKVLLNRLHGGSEHKTGCDVQWVLNIENSDTVLAGS